MTIKIYNSTSQPQFKNPCTTSKCSDICLPTISGGSICACPENQTLLSDNKTCEPDTTVNAIDGKYLAYHFIVIFLSFTKRVT